VIGVGDTNSEVGGGQTFSQRHNYQKNFAYFLWCARILKIYINKKQKTQTKKQKQKQNNDVGYLPENHSIEKYDGAHISLTTKQKVVMQ
jgi:hypothetical protein